VVSLEAEASGFHTYFLELLSGYRSASMQRMIARWSSILCWIVYAPRCCAALVWATCSRSRFRSVEFRPLFCYDFIIELVGAALDPTFRQSTISHVPDGDAGK
jgi:hypothetical protein